MTIRYITAFILSLLFTTAFGTFYIPWLKKNTTGQEVKSEVEWHAQKSGTPTMGGIMFILATLFVILTVGFEDMLKGKFMHLFVFLFALVFGAIGFLDDWEKLKKKQNLGLTANMKFLLQLAAALVFVFLMKKLGYISFELYIPYFNTTVQIPHFLYYLFSAFVIVGTVNSVNITDGVDGLCTITSIPVFLFFIIVSYLAGEFFVDLGVFSSAILGGLIGFLFFNYNPAKCFMGDTGSLFLGGAVVALAFCYDMPLILITLGIIYIAETVTDIIQILYFKATHGKRVFKMAPLHHHLELGGFLGHKWKEKELFFLFGGISLLFSIISLLGVLPRY